MKFIPLLIALLTGCTVSNPWKFETIATGEQVFDSARMIYSGNDSPLHFEIVRLEEGLVAFLNLKKFKFNTSDDVIIEFEIGEEKSAISVPSLEGRMRVRIPSDTAEQIILALQEGKEVAIMVEGFEQRLHSERFIKQYQKLTGNKAIFRNPFKGIFDP